MELINKYNEIIAELMNNDRNGSWDEIITEMEENYDGDDVIKYAIFELLEALECALENCDEEAREFYDKQYLKANKLLNSK